MRFRNSWVLYTCALGLMISITALSAQAAFNNASLKGGYSVLINRWTDNSGDNQFASVGVMTFDGAGKVSISFTSMNGGVEGTGTASGTYTVASNGSGTITFTTGSNPPQYAIVVNSSAAGLAKGITLMRIDTNYPSDAIESGTAVLQSTTAVTYSLAKVKGNLGFQLNQWTANPNNENGLVGILSFNGAGAVTGSFTARSGSGVLETGTVTGTYIVNSDGSGSMSLTASDGSTPQLSFALNTVTSTGPAKGMQLLQTSGNGNKALTGAALKQ
jgi:hypothetical protein